MAKAYGKSMFSFMKKIFELSFNMAVPFCTPTSNEWEFLFPPHHCQYLASPLFQILAILTCVYLYLKTNQKNVVLICVFLMTYDLEHFFICLFSICISFW